MAAGPPGARWRRENPASDTRQSTTTAWITRRAKYCLTAVPGAARPAPRTARRDLRSGLPPPLVHVPAVRQRIAVGDVVDDALLHALDAHVAEDGQVGKVGADHFLELEVVGAALGAVDLPHAILEELVDGGILVLAYVPARARLGGDVLAVDAVQAVGIVAHGGLDPDQQRLELGLHIVFAPDHGRRHVGDLHVHADGPPVLLDERLRLLAELVAGGGGVGERQAHAALGPHAIAADLPARLLQDLLGLVGAVLV